MGGEPGVVGNVGTGRVYGRRWRAEGDVKKTPCVTTEVGRGERDRMMPSHKSSSGLHTVGVPTIDCTKVGVPTIDCTKSDRLSDSQACLRAHCVVSSPCIYRLEIATFATIK